MAVSTPSKGPSLVERVREAPVTWLLIVINVLVFGFEMSKGGATKLSVLLSPEASVLLASGAVERTHVLAGEWWRLGTSMFVHIGIIHLLWNAWGSFGWCAAVEQELGKARFLFAYLASGVGGAALSVIVRDVTSAGASGACFGMIGATLILRQRHLASWGALVRDPFARRVFVSMGIWTAIGVTALTMDHGAHGGGFLVGTALTWALTARVPRWRVPRTALVLVAFGALVFAAVRPWWKPSEAPEYFAYVYLTGRVPPDASGAKFPIDYARARRFSRRACDQGNALGCEYLARIYQNGLGTLKDDTKVLRILSQSCERGDDRSCYLQGVRLGSDPRAADLFEKACDAPTPVWAACMSLAEFYRVGQGRPKDPTRARTLLQRACDAGYEDGCAGMLFLDGWLAPAGPVREAALAKLRPMCKEEGSWPCQLLHASERWPAEGGD